MISITLSRFENHARDAKNARTKTKRIPALAQCAFAVRPKIGQKRMLFCKVENLLTHCMPSRFAHKSGGNESDFVRSLRQILKTEINAIDMNR